MYCPHQYLLINPKIRFATPTLTPTNRPPTSKSRKYERGYLAYFYVRSASLLREDATPTLTLTNRPICGAHNFYAR